MKIAIIGSRDFTDYQLVEDTVFAHLNLKAIELVVSGGARGADTLAERFARQWGITMKVFPAQWGKYGNSAGYRRNVDIIKEADIVFAFWDGKSKGTQHSFDLCEQYKKKLILIKYNEL